MSLSPPSSPPPPRPLEKKPRPGRNRGCQENPLLFHPNEGGLVAPMPPPSLVPAALHFPDEGWSSFPALTALPGRPPSAGHTQSVRQKAGLARHGPAWDSGPEPFPPGGSSPTPPARGLRPRLHPAARGNVPSGKPGCEQRHSRNLAPRELSIPQKGGGTSRRRLSSEQGEVLLDTAEGRGPGFVSV